MNWKLFMFFLYELIRFCLTTKQGFLSPAQQLRQMLAEVPDKRNDGFLDRQDDNIESANEHGQNGRVLIKVFRGPDIRGEHDEYFAPFGYWVKQPAADGERRYRR